MAATCEFWARWSEDIEAGGDLLLASAAASIAVRNFTVHRGEFSGLGEFGQRLAPPGRLRECEAGFCGGMSTTRPADAAARAAASGSGGKDWRWASTAGILAWKWDCAGQLQAPGDSGFKHK